MHERSLGGGALPARISFVVPLESAQCRSSETSCIVPHPFNAMDANKPNLPHDWEAIDDVIVAVTAPGVIQNDRWAQFIETLQRPQTKKIFNLVRGEVTIDAVKRKQAADAVSQGKLEVIVVTDSRITRGVLTAVSWLGANIKAFSWSDLDKAVEKAVSSATAAHRIQEIAKAFHQLTLG